MMTESVVITDDWRRLDDSDGSDGEDIMSGSWHVRGRSAVYRDTQCMAGRRISRQSASARWTQRRGRGGVQNATNRAGCETTGSCPGGSGSSAASAVRGERTTTRQTTTPRTEDARVMNARCPGMQPLHPGASMRAIECVYRGWRDYVSLSALLVGALTRIR